VRIASRLPIQNAGLLMLGALTLIFAGCSRRSATEGTELLPGQLHGLQLVESKSGAEAAAEIARIHKLDVAPQASEVGVYEAAGVSAELYVSRFNTPDEATSQFEAMVSAINEGVPGFGHHNHFDVVGRDVHVVFGNARVNYFYADADKLTWLAAQHPMFARAALAQLLGVALDSIPRLPGTPPQQSPEGAPS